MGWAGADDDGDGMVSQQELLGQLEDAGAGASGADAAVLLASLDGDGDGKLNAAEYAALDADGDGIVSQEELLEAVRRQQAAAAPTPGLGAPSQPGQIVQSPVDLMFYVAVLDDVHVAAGSLKWTPCAIVAPPRPIKKYR